MSGFMGFGQSGGEKSSTGNINSVFNYALPTAKTGEAAGQTNQGDAAAYFQKLLTGGRTAAEQNAAPAVNAAQQQADTVRKQEAATGTNRGGGTAGEDREASTATQSNIDNIINQNLVGGRAAAAGGLAQIGANQQQNANQLINTAQQGQDILYTGAINKEGAQGADFSKLLAGPTEDASTAAFASALGL